MIDLNPHHLETVNTILAEHVPECEVRAFGSRATWTAKDYSDLDLAIVGKGPLDWKMLGRLKEAFEESNLPMRVDVLDWHSISDRFRKAIKRDCVVIQKGGKQIKTGDWRKVTLGDCAQLARDNISPSDAGDVPYIGLEHIGEDSLTLVGHGGASDVTSTKTRFRRGDILFGKLRPYFRKVIRVPFDGICSTDIWVIRAKEGIDQGFLFYCFANQAVVDFATSAAEGTRMPRAKWDYVARYEFPLPPLPEQRRIAHILGTLDDKIELNRRMNATLEEMARTLFKSWFVDFFPVRAKMEGRWCRGESLPGLPAELYDLFPEQLAPSELGDVPEGWSVKTVEDVAEKVAMGPFGSSIKVSTFVDEGIPIISGQHLKGTLLEDNEYRFITEDHAQKLANANVQRRDLIFTHAGGIGQVACIPETSKYDRYVISQRQFYLRCDPMMISPLFVLYFFKTPGGQHQLLANTSSTGVPSIARPVTYLRSIKFCVPPKGLWSLFGSIVHQFHLRAGWNSTESSTLAALRDALLPKLVSGGTELG